MSGIRKWLWNKEKSFFIFLRCAGFFLRFFAYVEAGYRKLGYQLLRKKPVHLAELFPRLRGDRLCAFCRTG
jgi:hypothetical protein